MLEPQDRDRLADLQRRIEAAKGAGATEASDRGKEFSQAQLGWQMVIELTSGLLIGFGMGYGLDVLLGTLPIFLVIFTILGFAAGVRVMMRTAQHFQAERTEVPTAETDKPAEAGTRNKPAEAGGDEGEKNGG